jgi:hypothetical protein
MVKLFGEPVESNPPLDKWSAREPELDCEPLLCAPPRHNSFFNFNKDGGYCIASGAVRLAQWLACERELDREPLLCAPPRHNSFFNLIKDGG